MSKKKKVILYGAGAGGARSLLSLKGEYEVVAIVDSNTRLHGSFLYDVKVHSPEIITSMKFDKIYISSSYHEAIYSFLVNDLKVDESKLHVVSKRILNGLDVPTTMFPLHLIVVFITFIFFSLLLYLSIR